MTFTTNRVMIDSSILVEYIKNTKTKLLIKLISDVKTECFINETVVSEYLYYFLALNGGRSPRATQSAEEIHLIFSGSSDYKIINRFELLSTSKTLFSLAPDYMSKYNLLPNDAIILATCKMHGITQLASHDKDFEVPCKAEGITLLRED